MHHPAGVLTATLKFRLKIVIPSTPAEVIVHGNEASFHAGCALTPWNTGDQRSVGTTVGVLDMDADVHEHDAICSDGE